MANEKTMKKGFAVRDFTDAGTEKSFVAGTEIEVEEGAYANYRAGGLVADEKPGAAAQPDEPSANKGARKA